jgi:hypothetical protein
MRLLAVQWMSKLEERPDLVACWLARPLWPWPLALAYSLAEPSRNDALNWVCQIFDEYPSLGSPTSDLIGSSSIRGLAQALPDDEPQTSDAADKLDWPDSAKVLAVERPLIAWLECDDLKGWGRRDFDDQLERIPAESWIGGEIVHRKTCELRPEGRRATEGLWFPDLGATTWYFDVHITRDTMIQKFGGIGPSPDVQPIDPPEHVNWADDAVQRGVTISGCREDARRALGDKAPPRDRCRQLLHDARLRAGVETKQGRPLGRKSFYHA